jgi:hypothetical protein
MTTLALRKVFAKDNLLVSLLASKDIPVVPRATAAVIAKRKSDWFITMRVTGFRRSVKVLSEARSLCEAVSNGGIERRSMDNSPSENEVIRRIQETKEANAEEDLLCDQEIEIPSRRL